MSFCIEAPTNIEQNSCTNRYVYFCIKTQRKSVSSFWPGLKPILMIWNQSPWFTMHGIYICILHMQDRTRDPCKGKRWVPDSPVPAQRRLVHACTCDDVIIRLLTLVNTCGQMRLWYCIAIYHTCNILAFNDWKLESCLADRSNRVYWEVCLKTTACWFWRMDSYRSYQT